MDIILEAIILGLRQPLDIGILWMLFGYFYMFLCIDEVAISRV